MIAYHDRYGYPMRGALVAEFWWRVEHLFWRHYRGHDGGLFGAINGYGYTRRKRAERRWAPSI